MSGYIKTWDMEVQIADRTPERISIIVPVYNEEESIKSLYEKVNAVMAKMEIPYEVIFVDDGSMDGSFNVLQRLYQQDNNVTVIQFRRNFGKAAALTAGFREARGDVVITMDADLQDEPKEIPRLLQKLDEGYDLVSGWKKKRYDPISKTLPSKIFNRITSWLTGIKIPDVRG